MGRNLDQILCVHIMSICTGASCAVWIVNAQVEEIEMSNDVNPQSTEFDPCR
jgi:hypothetical protein